MSSGHKGSKEKTRNSGKKTSGPDKTSGAGSILALGMVLMILIIPLALCFYSAPPAEPYTVIPVNPLPAAVQAAGASICSTADKHWDVPGATGGKTYVISYNCAAQTSSNTITVQVQAFDSTASREAAVQTYNTMTVGRGKPAGNLFAYNQYLIYVTPPNTNLMKSIGAELQKMKASR